MPWNGTGTFARALSWVIDSITTPNLTATHFDSDADDLASGITNCIARDGQAPPTADTPWGSKKITFLANGVSAQDAVTYSQVFTSPTFTDATLAGTPTADTAPVGTSSTQLATTAFAAALAFHSALPAQLGNSGKFITTDGSTASWTAISIVRSARTSDTILAVADKFKLVDFTSGTFTQTFTAAATLGDGWYCYLKNSGTGDITLNPNGSETIDGLTTFVMYPGEARLIQCDGSNFNSIVLSPYAKTFTATATWTKPPGYKEHGTFIIGGGSSGQRNNSITDISIGGAGAGASQDIIPDSLLGTTETITIGAGGAAITTVADGTLGGRTSIGTVITTSSNAWNIGGAVGTGDNQGPSDWVNDGTTNAFGFEAQGAAASSRNAVWAGVTPSNDASTGGGRSRYGGGCGGSLNASATVRAPGVSLFSGDGGAASSTSNGTDGSIPGGGGGATQTGTQSGAGGRGECRMWGIA